MKTRVDVATDVAAIALWDVEREADPVSGAGREAMRLLEEDAAHARVFVLYIGADAAGPVDIYVNDAIPADEMERLRPAGGEFLLTLPSGRLIVNGAEYHRSSNADVARSAIPVPAGKFSVRCYARKDPEQLPRSEERLQARVGKADLDYYDRMNTLGCAGSALTLLLFPILLLSLGWIVALVITAVAFVAYFPAREKLMKRNERYARLHAIVPLFRLQHEDPWLVFELRTVTGATSLEGGSATL